MEPQNVENNDVSDYTLDSRSQQDPNGDYLTEMQNSPENQEQQSEDEFNYGTPRAESSSLNISPSAQTSPGTADSSATNELSQSQMIRPNVEPIQQPDPRRSQRTKKPLIRYTP